MFTLALDPATGLPREEKFLGQVEGLVGMGESAFGTAPPPPIGGRGGGRRRPRPRPTPEGGRLLLSQYTHDFAPIPASTFRPTLPPGTTLYDIDKIRETWKGPLTRTLARLSLGGKDLLIHDIRIDAWGDILLFYSGRLPENVIAVKQPDGKSTPAFGYLRVEDSLGRVSAPLPNPKSIFGKPTDQRTEPVKTSPKIAYLSGSRIDIPIMTKVLPPPPPGYGEGIAALGITCHVTEPDPRPRTITLRWTIFPRDPSAEPRTLEYKSGVLTPQPPSDILIPHYSPSVEPPAPADLNALERRIKAWQFRESMGHPPASTDLDALFAEVQKVGIYEFQLCKALYDWNRKFKRDQQAVQVAQYALKIAPKDGFSQDFWGKELKTAVPVAAAR
jgi:hypothetical protein